MAVDGKIQSLNTAIKEAIPNMQDVADENPNAQVLVRFAAIQVVLTAALLLSLLKIR